MGYREQALILRALDESLTQVQAILDEGTLWIADFSVPVCVALAQNALLKARKALEAEAAANRTIEAIHAPDVASRLGGAADDLAEKLGIEKAARIAYLEAMVAQLTRAKRPQVRFGSSFPR